MGLALPVAVHNIRLLKLYIILIYRVILVTRIPQPYILSKPICARTPAEDSLYRTCAPIMSPHTPLTIFIDLHAYNMFAACTTHACRLRLHILLGAYFLSNNSYMYRKMYSELIERDREQIGTSTLLQGLKL